MRKLILGIALASTLAPNIGCILPAYSGDPTRRTQQLIYTSENLRMLLEDWERLWMLDQPSHLSPYKTHGGIL
ncbi:MAG: hypothetical protein JSS27_07075 [Planctomycetes bacterium]|nr:hypothetical protein [Planctomycetota bacterium]